MKLGIMQPYLFPYIGYFQLIHAVDAFLIYDDVNFIKQGWINRNRILMNGTPISITLSLKVSYDAYLVFGVERKGRSILLNNLLSVLSSLATKIFITFKGGAITAKI